MDITITVDDTLVNGVTLKRGAVAGVSDTLGTSLVSAFLAVPAGVPLPPLTQTSQDLLAEYLRTLANNSTPAGAAAVAAATAPCAVNFTAANTQPLVAALIQGLTGAARTRACIGGTSLTKGTANGAFALQAWPMAFAAAMRGRYGAPLLQASVCGGPNANGGPVADARVVFGGTSDNQTDILGVVGGGYLRMIAAGTDTISFTPGFAFDTIDVQAVQQNYAYTIEFSFDGGSTWPATLVATAGGFTDLSTYTYSLAAGTTATKVIARLKAASAGPAIFPILNCRLANQPTLEVHNMGSGGMKVSDWNNGALHGATEMALWQDANATNITFFEAGANEAIQGVALATFVANLTTAFTAQQAKGPVVYIVPYEPNTTGTYGLAAGVYDSYYNAATALATGMGIPSIDGRLADKATFAANDFVGWKDGIHSSNARYSQVGLLVANTISRFM